MKKLFAKLRGKSSLKYNDKGIYVSTSTKENKQISWENITKIVFVDHFEEYSGYFLTEEYLNKELYHDIFVNCNQNMVKIRTGSTPTVKNNTSKPFSTKFGTTCIYHAVFVEYWNKDKEKNLFAVHYDENNKANLMDTLKGYLKESLIFSKKRSEGFHYITNLS